MMTTGHQDMSDFIAQIMNASVERHPLRRVQMTIYTTIGPNKTDKQVKIYDLYSKENLIPKLFDLSLTHYIYAWTEEHTITRWGVTDIVREYRLYFASANNGENNITPELIEALNDFLMRKLDSVKRE